MPLVLAVSHRFKKYRQQYLATGRRSHFNEIARYLNLQRHRPVVNLLLWLSLWWECPWHHGFGGKGLLSMLRHSLVEGHGGAFARRILRGFSTRIWVLGFGFSFWGAQSCGTQHFTNQLFKSPVANSLVHSALGGFQPLTSES